MPNRYACNQCIPLSYFAILSSSFVGGSDVHYTNAAGTTSRDVAVHCNPNAVRLLAQICWKVMYSPLPFYFIKVLYKVYCPFIASVYVVCSCQAVCAMSRDFSRPGVIAHEGEYDSCTGNARAKTSLY